MGEKVVQSHSLQQRIDWDVVAQQRPSVAALTLALFKSWLVIIYALQKVGLILLWGRTK